MDRSRRITRVILSGDRAAAESLRPTGMTLLGAVRNALQLSPGLSTYRMDRRLADGSTVTAVVSRGQEQVFIWCPTVRPVREFVDWALAYLCRHPDGDLGYLVCDFDLVPTGPFVYQPKAKFLCRILTPYTYDWYYGGFQQTDNLTTTDISCGGVSSGFDAGTVVVQLDYFLQRTNVFDGTDSVRQYTASRVRTHSYSGVACRSTDTLAATEKSRIEWVLEGYPLLYRVAQSAYEGMFPEVYGWESAQQACTLTMQARMTQTGTELIHDWENYRNLVEQHKFAEAINYTITHSVALNLNGVTRTVAEYSAAYAYAKTYDTRVMGSEVETYGWTVSGTTAYESETHCFDPEQPDDTVIQGAPSAGGCLTCAYVVEDVVKSPVTSNSSNNDLVVRPTLTRTGRTAEYIYAYKDRSGAQSFPFDGYTHTITVEGVEYLVEFPSLHALRKPFDTTKE